MEGGSVAGNAAPANSADVRIGAPATFRLSGAAQIGILALVATSSSNGSSVTLAGPFTGSVVNLDLWGGIFIKPGTSTSYYLNSDIPVLKADSGQSLTQTVIDKFSLRYVHGDLYLSSSNYIGIDGYLY